MVNAPRSYKAPKNSGAVLKRKGLIPKAWDLRDLSDYKKKKIRSIAWNYAEVLRSPQDFSIRKIGSVTEKRLKDTGYDLVNHRVILPTKGTYKYKVTKDRIVIDKPNRVDTVLLSSGPNFLKRLDKLAKNENPRFGLPPGEYYSLKIGDHDTFLSHAKSLEKLMDYGRIKAFNSSNARDYVSLVHVKFKPGFEPRPTPIPDLERTFNPLPTATRKTKARKRAKKTQG